MNIRPDLFRKYDQLGSLIVFSEYADSPTGGTGLSRYSKSTARVLAEQLRLGGKIIIVANQTSGERILEEGDILVLRTFERDNIMSFFRTLWVLLRFQKVKSVLFEFEFASYGGAKITSIIPLMLLVMKLFGKSVYFAMHQVVTDLNELHKQIGLEAGSGYLWLLNLGSKLFYVLTGLLSEKVIVLEEELKRRLDGFVPSKKVIVIPHTIEKIRTIKTRAYYRELFGFTKDDFVILCFGYIAWYKGIDRLVRVFGKLPQTVAGRKLHLIVAGGKSVAQVGKPHYEKYFSGVKSLVKKTPRARFADFVPENEMEKYFLAADLCILPYRKFVSSSGPLSLAISFKRPIVLSEELEPYLMTDDFRGSLEESGLSSENLFIKIDAQGLETFVSKVLGNDSSYNNGIYTFEKGLALARRWEKLAPKYLQVFGNRISWHFSYKDLLEWFIRNGKTVVRQLTFQTIVSS